MQDFLLGGLLLVISTYIILKLLEDVLPILLSDRISSGVITTPRPSNRCAGKAGRCRKSRRRSTGRNQV